MAMRPGEIEDPRSSLYRLRRKQLEAILYDNQIPYPQDIPAETSRMMIQQSGVDVTRYIDRESKAFLWPKSWVERKKAAQEAEMPPNEPVNATSPQPATPGTPEEIVAQRPDYGASEASEQGVENSSEIPVERLKMPELRKMAKRMGIEQSPKDSKALLAKKIRERLSGEPA